MIGFHLLAGWPSQAGRQTRSMKVVRHSHRPASVQNTVSYVGRADLAQDGKRQVVPGSQ
jgi:hypothetical protein